MSKIHAILLIPAAGDPHGLLGDPESVAWKCGARPPMAHNKGSGWAAGAHPWDIPHALVLRWGDEVVHDGMHRAARAAEGVAENWEDETGLERYNIWWCHPVDAANLATVCEALGLGVVVRINAEGQEVTP